MSIQKRNLATSIILSIVTCGIYCIYWFVVTTDEAKIVSNDQEGASGGVAFLLSIITCGIYRLYWNYKQGERIDEARAMRGIPGGGSSHILFLVLALFGLDFVNYIIVQDALNKISDFDAMNGPFNGTYNNGGYYNNNGYNNMNNANNNMNNGYNNMNNGYNNMNNGYNNTNNGYNNMNNANNNMNNNYNNQAGNYSNENTNNMNQNYNSNQNNDNDSQN